MNEDLRRVAMISGLLVLAALALSPAHAEKLPNATSDAATRHCLDHIARTVRMYRGLPRHTADAQQKLGENLRRALATNWNTLAPARELRSMIARADRDIQEAHSFMDQARGHFWAWDAKLQKCRQARNCQPVAVRTYESNKKAVNVFFESWVTESENIKRFAICALEARREIREPMPVFSLQQCKIETDCRCNFHVAPPYRCHECLFERHQSTCLALTSESQQDACFAKLQNRGKRCRQINTGYLEQCQKWKAKNC